MRKNIIMKYTFPILALASCITSAKPENIIKGHVFAWPFTPTKEMQPRGGSTKGTKVILDKKPSKEWSALQEKSLPKIEKDRRAILAMAGSYRVSFDFIETMGFQPDYTPPKPYFSWGTEHIQILENNPKSISLQHTLVMYFKAKDGKEIGPMVMKHWRQDWEYQDTELHTYQGNATWAHTSKSPEQSKGKWSQAVFQVDDSPRYEVLGSWTHIGNMSTWKSNTCARPLPRREFSARKDYNILQGNHEISITPTGWVHIQQNQKIASSTNNQTQVIAQELGVNRYQRISSPSLKAAEDTWKKTSVYWKEVRNAWKQVYKNNQSFSLKPKADGKKLYQHHFEYAAQLEKQNTPIDQAKAKNHAIKTIQKFLISGKNKTNDNTPNKY